MRKQFFFKSMFCLILGLVCNVAWAQPQVSNAPSDGQWAEGTTWFVMSTLSGYLYGSEFVDNDGLLQLNRTKTNTGGEHLLWSVVEGEEGKYYIYNKAKGANVVLGFYDTTPSGDNRTYRAKFVSKDDSNYTTLFEIVRSQKSTSNQDYWCLRAPDTNKYWNPQGYLTYWNSASATNDNGSAHMFVESDIVEGMEYEFTDNVGNSFTGTFTGMKSTTFVQPSYTGVDGATLSNLSCTESKFSATITFPFPVSKEGGATNWRFIETAPVNSKKTYISVRTNDNKIISKSTDSGNGMTYFPTANLDEIKKWMWAFYPEFANGNFTFKIKNAATGMYVPSTPRPTSNSQVNNNISVTDKASAGSFSWGTCIGSGKGFYLSDDLNIVFGANSTTAGDQNAMLWYKNGTHAGCNLTIINPRYYVNYSITDNCNLIYTGASVLEYTPNAIGALAEPAAPTLTGIPANMIGGAAFENNTYTATVTLPFPTSDPTKVAPTMIESFAPSYTTALFYWYTPNGTNIRVAKNVSPSPLNVDSYKWAIYPQLESGLVMKFIIKHIETNKYVYTTSTTNTHGDNTVTLNNTATKFLLESDGRLKRDGSNVYLSINTSSEDDGDEENLGTHSNQHEGTKLTYPVVSYNINVSEKNVASLTSPFAVTIPDGVVAKYVKSEDNQTITEALTYTYLNGTIPANTPVIINGPAGNQRFEMTDETIAVEGNNILFSYNAETAVQGSGHESNVYSMTVENGKVAFRPFGGENFVAGETYLDITGKFAEQAPSSLNIYDYIAYKTEIEDYDNTTISENPNTHLGTITLSSDACRIDNKLSSANVDALMESIKYWAGGFSLELTRKYRGYEFLGFWLGEEELGTTPTLTEEQANSVTEANHIIAKYRPTEEVTLFYDDDEFSYRIPAITTTGTGRIFAVSDYRHNLDDIGRDKHGTGTMRIDLVARYSDNNGETWSEAMTIAAGDNSKTGSYLRAFGDAAIAAVGEKIVVMSAAGDVFYLNGSLENPNRMARIFSTDNGETWSIEEMTTKLYSTQESLLPNVSSAFFGSGKLAVDLNFNNTENARIYGALLVKIGGDNYNNYVVYSDDLGANWKILGGSQTSIADGDEPKVEILPNGQILLSVRRSGGRIFNVFTYGSNDGDKANGIGTWNDNENFNNGGADCNGETFCVDATKPDGTKTKLLLQSQPKGSDRSNVSIWYKEISPAADATHTSADIAGDWTFGLQVSTQKSAYSAMTLQKDGKIGFFFEEAPCFGDDHTKGYSMVYVPLTIDEITRGRYLASNTDFEAEKSISVTLTDAEGNVYKDELNASLAGIGTALTTKYPFITLGNNVGINLVDESYTYTNTVTLPFKVSNETEIWHNIYIPTHTGSRYPVYFYSESETDNTVKSKHTSVIYGASDYNSQVHADNMSWAIYNVDNGFAFILKNKITGKYIKVSQPASAKNENVQYDTKENASAFTIEKNTDKAGDYVIKHGTGHLSVYSSDAGYLTFYSGGIHYGSTAKIVEAPDFDALIDGANAVLNLFGDGLGQYSGLSAENQTAVDAAKSAMENAGTVKLNTLNEYKGYASKTTGATLNLPQSGQFMRIKGISGNYIDASSIYNNAQATTGQMSMKSAEQCNYASTIFYFDEEKHLLNYATGTYTKQTREIGTVGDSQKGVWTFAESPRKGNAKYALSSTTTDNAGANLHDNSGNRADRCSSNCGDRHDFTLEEVTSLPFTFKKAALGFATFNAPVAVQLPAGVLAYITDMDETKNVLQMYRLEGNVVPANTPVMLYNDAAKADGAENETTIDLLIVDAYTGDEFEKFEGENDFVGTIEAENLNADKNCYSLQVNKNDPTKVGFYNKTTGTKGGFKAWLETDEAEGVRAFTIIFDGDDATGLKEALGLENENVEIYDLSGRRLDKPAKGVNVIGGKLVIK